VAHPLNTSATATTAAHMPYRFIVSHP